MKTIFDTTDLIDTFEVQILERGVSYHESGRVEQVRTKISRNGRKMTIEGVVRGSRGKTYHQHIEIFHGYGHASIEGECTCPVGYNCKHVVAVLLEVLHQRDNKSDRIGTTETQHSPLPGHTAAPCDDRLLQWLEQVQQAASGREAAQDPNAYPDHIHERLIYVLAPDDRKEDLSPASIRFLVARRLLKGGYSKTVRRYNPENALRDTPARFLRPVDLDILRQLYWEVKDRDEHGHFWRAEEDYDLSRLPGGASLLEKILGTGRCHFGSLKGPLLQKGPQRRGAFFWHRSEDGLQQLRVRLLPEGEKTEAKADGTDKEKEAQALVLPVNPPWYLDLKTGLCGPLDLGISPGLAARLAAAPPLHPRDAALVREQLGKIFGDAEKAPMPPPEMPEKVIVRKVKPTPVLRLIRGNLKYDPAFFEPFGSYFSRPFEKVSVPLARLSFDYDGTEIADGTPGASIDSQKGDETVIIPRDHKAEQEARKILHEFGFVRIEDIDLFSKPARHRKDYFLTPDPDLTVRMSLSGPERLKALYFEDPSRFISFSAEGIPWLQKEKGWRVKVAKDYPVRLLDETDVHWWGEIEDDSSTNWFSFTVGVEVDGERVNLIPVLTGILRQLPAELFTIEDTSKRNAMLEKIVKDHLHLWTQLDDGRLVPLEAERVVPVMRMLLDVHAGFGTQDEDKLRISPLESADLAELAEEVPDIAWRGHERVWRVAEALRRIAREGLPKIAPPPNLRTTLRPYQHQGLSWLVFLREAGLGGILADDMGLGKTVQTLAFLLLEKNEGRLKRPALIVSPTSVLPNWEAELQRFAPDLRVLRLHGPERKARFAQVSEYDVLLTTYPLLARDEEFWRQQPLHAIILDEAQAIKNPKSRGAIVAAQLRADVRLALTGTPVENNLEELWSLFNVLNPGFLGDLKTFRRRFRTPIEKRGDTARMKLLKRRIRPLVLRRSKEEVVRELPPKTEITEYVALEGAQRDLYETIRLMMNEKVRRAIAEKGLERARIEVLDALLKLRQVCCDPRLVKLPAARKVKGSAKLHRLMEMLPELIAEGRRILLFSQFTSMLDLIRPELEKHKIDYVEITGKTKDRKIPVERFQAGDVPLFLISLKAGGSGLNLTAADTVIHYDPWWNPAVENQATDRAHRIGQDKPVFVHRLIVKNSVEEAIEQLKQKKAELAASLLEEGKSARFTLTEDDIDALFAPLE